MPVEIGAVGQGVVLAGRTAASPVERPLVATPIGTDIPLLDSAVVRSLRRDRHRPEMACRWMAASPVPHSPYYPENLPRRWMVASHAPHPPCHPGTPSFRLLQDTL